MSDELKFTDPNREARKEACRLAALFLGGSAPRNSDDLLAVARFILDGATLPGARR